MWTLFVAKENAFKVFLNFFLGLLKFSSVLVFKKVK